MLHELAVFWFSQIQAWGYTGIVVLMAMESSIFPVPSEIVVPPAAYWASQGQMNFWGVVLAGTVGSYLGAAATYWVSRWLGRPAIARWGRYFGCGPDKIERGERMLSRYVASGIFFSRLLPVVRHVIGIPAGILRVDFRTYSLATLAGSFLWCWVLAWFGLRIGQRHPGAINDYDLFKQAFWAEALWIIIAIGVLAALYVAMLVVTGRKPKKMKEKAA